MRPFWDNINTNNSKAACMLAKSAKTGPFFDRPIVFGYLDFRPICISAEKSAEIKFDSDQKSAENRLKQPIRTVHNF